MTPSRCRRLRSLAVLLLALLWPPTGAAQTPGSALLIEMEGPIGPATSDFLTRQIDRSEAEQHRLIILRINTPGGLDTSMRAIIQRILASRTPIVAYVAPEGARAASAGTYILYASHVAAMAPATNLGAATPVPVGGGGFPGGDKSPFPSEPGQEKKRSSEEQEPAEAGPKGAMERKVVNDAAAYIRGLAKLRGRNAEWAERAVRRGESLTAEDALEAGVIDILARDVPALIEALDGRTVNLGAETIALETRDLAIEVVEPDWINRILSLITNPNVAYVFMLLGIYGLFFELANPGAVFPGVFGAISLLIALYALHLLPVNYAGFALVLLGIGLMVGEAFTPTFGVLGVGGTIAFVVGSLLLVDSDIEGFTVSIPLVAAVALVSAAFFILVTGLALRQRRKPVVSGQENLIGSTGRALSSFADDGSGYVLVHGERWRASSSESIPAEAMVRIKAVHGLTLDIEPLDPVRERPPAREEN